MSNADVTSNEQICALSSLRKGDKGVVLAVDDSGDLFGDARASTIARRLLELGFVPGAGVEIVATMWPGDDPLAVRVGGSTFALRHHEARIVRVSRHG